MKRNKIKVEPDNRWDFVRVETECGSIIKFPFAEGQEPSGHLTWCSTAKP